MGKPILSWFNKDVEDFTYNMDSDLKEACIAAIGIQQKVGCVCFAPHLINFLMIEQSTFQIFV